MRRFLPYKKYLLPVLGTFIFAILCGLVSSVANGAGLPALTRYVFPRVFNNADVTAWEIAIVTAWIPFVFIIRGVFGYLNTYFIQYVGTSVLERLRLDYFKKLQLLPLSFFQKHNSGDLISRGIADTNQLQNTLSNASNELIKAPATLIAALCFFVYLSFRESGIALTLVCLAGIPACVFPIRYAGKKIVRRAVQLQGELGALTQRFGENLSTAREVRAYRLEQRETDRFAITSRALVKFQMKVVKYSKAIGPTVEIISSFGIAATFVYAYSAHVALEALIAIVLALYGCYDPVKNLANLSNEIKRGLASLDRIEEVMNEPIDIADPATPAAITRFNGNISFNKVSFAYKSGHPVLKNVSIQIPAGTTTALVGPSGAGKTTFINLVPRFYDTTDGNITIDGIDLRDMRLADLRDNIALVSQEPVLFNDTIYNNILLGRPNATQADIHQAAIDASAHDFITKLPNGYDTIIGERGSSLSGGQRQRVAIARAFLRNAPILILDEVTAALDSNSEAAIQSVLGKLEAGRTVLIIAHRFSTIRDADNILLFESGNLIASGPHAKLYENAPLYRALYDRQATTQNS